MGFPSNVSGFRACAKLCSTPAQPSKQTPPTPFMPRSTNYRRSQVECAFGQPHSAISLGTTRRIYSEVFDKQYDVPRSLAFGCSLEACCNSDSWPSACVARWLRRVWLGLWEGFVGEGLEWSSELVRKPPRKPSLPCWDACACTSKTAHAAPPGTAVRHKRRLRMQPVAICASGGP